MWVFGDREDQTEPLSNSQVWSTSCGRHLAVHRWDKHRALLLDGGDAAAGEHFWESQAWDSSSQSEQTSHQAARHRYVLQFTETLLFLFYFQGKKREKRLDVGGTLHLMVYYLCFFLFLIIYLGCKISKYFEKSMTALKWNSHRQMYGYLPLLYFSEIHILKIPIHFEEQWNNTLCFVLKY